MVVVGTQTERQLREQVDQAEQQFEHHVTTRQRQRLAKDRKVQKRGEQGRDPKRVQRILNIKDTEGDPEKYNSTSLALRIRCWRCRCYAGGGGPDREEGIPLCHSHSSLVPPVNCNKELDAGCPFCCLELQHFYIYHVFPNNNVKILVSRGAMASQVTMNEA